MSDEPETVEDNQGPDRPLHYAEPTANFEHEFNGEVCIRCNRTMYDARTRICDAEAHK